MRRRLIVCAALFMTTMALSAVLEGQSKGLPPGTGKYLVVLWDPGTPIPGSTSGEKIKKTEEPDFSKMGGRLVSKRDNRRVVTLPHAAIKQLRRHQAVAYVQRLWTGESLQGWEDESSSDSGLKVETHADIDLAWGPRSYVYDGAGNVTAIGTDSFVYDSVGRLKQATINGKTETYAYDAFGNLTEKASSGQPPVSIPVDSASNRLDGPQYDAAGNVTSRGNRADYAYDSLNMMTYSRNGRRMIYDAEDERIGTMLDSSTSRWTMRDFEGQIIREYKSEELGSEMIWIWHLDHVRGENQLLAGESQAWGYVGTNMYGGKRHYHIDHLGSVRIVTDKLGRSLSEHDFYPFGVSQSKTYQEQINWGDPHIDSMRFAGHWRDFLGWLDVENSDYLDAMHARYYDPNVGRFLSVDPNPGSVDLAVPQSWNRYTYALNSPLVFIDPSGEIVEFADAYTEQLYRDYMKSLDVNSQDYVNAMLLESSEVTYVIRVKDLPDNVEGSLTSDGVKVFITLDSGGPNQAASLGSRMAHEIQHGAQFENGCVGFIKQGAQWTAIFTDVYDEVEAWNAQLRRQEPGDLWRGQLRNYSNQAGELEQAQFLTTIGYSQYANRLNVRSSAPVTPGFAPGAVVNNGTLFYRTPR
ncbi:MAG TPA: RHS repeat-associated core domain-containing protein [Thermoanaerobaculia bacterium]|nr:RHS repeat-associated core domain-containing protein [Thermoanaerobaculia bacterium]